MQDLEHGAFEGTHGRMVDLPSRINVIQVMRLDVVVMVAQCHETWPVVDVVEGGVEPILIHIGDTRMVEIVPEQKGQGGALAFRPLRDIFLHLDFVFGHREHSTDSLAAYRIEFAIEVRRYGVAQDSISKHTVQTKEK